MCFLLPRNITPNADSAQHVKFTSSCCKFYSLFELYIWRELLEAALFENLNDSVLMIPSVHTLLEIRDTHLLIKCGRVQSCSSKQWAIQNFK